uniref:Uncharacterized protein n=1 Tax=Solanum tuberosum TaxID=4113 RepID=M1DA32_SOLTU
MAKKLEKCIVWEHFRIAELVDKCGKRSAQNNEVCDIGVSRRRNELLKMLYWNFKLDDDQGLVLPLAEPEYRRRLRRLTYPVPLVVSEPTSQVARIEQEEPEIMAEMKVRDVAIPHTTNVTSCIQKPAVGGRLELK